MCSHRKHMGLRCFGCFWLLTVRVWLTVSLDFFDWLEQGISIVFDLMYLAVKIWWIQFVPTNYFGIRWWKLPENNLSDFLRRDQGLEYKIRTIKRFVLPFNDLCCHGNSCTILAWRVSLRKNEARLVSGSAYYTFIDNFTILHQFGGLNYFPLQSCWAKSRMRCTTFSAGSSSVVKKSLLGFLTSDLSSSLKIFGPLPMAITCAPLIQGSCGLKCDENKGKLQV